MIGEDIQYKVGQNETMEYSCLCCDANGGTFECGNSENATIVLTHNEIVDVYNTFSAGGLLSRTVGYWLAVLGVVGLIGVFVSLRSEGFMQPK